MPRIKRDKFAPPPIKRNKTCCSVYRCSSTARRNPNVHFHLFPRPEQSFVNLTNELGITERVDRLKAWETTLKMTKKISPYMKVCSLHFRKEDYILPDVPTLKLCLKKTAVPSCNLPNCPAPYKKKKDTDEQYSLTPCSFAKAIKLEYEEEQQHQQQRLVENQSPEEEYILPDIIPNNGFRELRCEPNCSQKSDKNFDLQVQNRDLKPQHMVFIKTEFEHASD